MEMQIKPIDSTISTAAIDPADHLGLVRREVYSSPRYRDLSAKWFAAGQQVTVEDSDEYAEGCVALVRATHGFDPDRGVKFSTFATWSIRNAINRMYGYENASMRDRSRELLECDCVLDQNEQSPIDVLVSPCEIDTEIERAENRVANRKLLKRLMRRLTPRAQQMIRLFYFRGIPQADIAKQMVPPTTEKCVNATISKAIRAMREYVALKGIEP